MKKLMLLILIVGMASAITADSPDPSVWITETGTKYHRMGCRYLDKSAIEIPLSQAKERDLQPCKVCRPDENAPTEAGAL